MGLKVAVKDVVVPIALAAGGAGLGELDVQSPGAGAGLGWGHVVSAGIVVPRADELDALDVGWNQEGKGVAGGGRHY